MQRTLSSPLPGGDQLRDGCHEIRQGRDENAEINACHKSSVVLRECAVNTEARDDCLEASGQAASAPVTDKLHKQ